MKPFEREFILILLYMLLGIAARTTTTTNKKFPYMVLYYIALLRYSKT